MCHGPGGQRHQFFDQWQTDETQWACGIQQRVTKTIIRENNVTPDGIVFGTKEIKAKSAKFSEGGFVQEAYRKALTLYI